MACSVSSIVSSNPRVISSNLLAPMASLPPAPWPLSKTLAVPKSFHRLRKDFQPRSSPLVSAPKSSRRSFVVDAIGESELPLVGNLAPDFEAEAVFDQEFIRGIALRGLFIIDKEGVIQHSTINNLAFGRSVDETMRTLQALQYVQENPDEVCPAGWKPGEKSMKPDPKLSKEYFAAI